MSYHRNRKPSAAVALGDAASVGKAVAVTGRVMTDPYFNEAVCRIDQLSAIEDRKPVPYCATTRSGLTGGVGLRVAMPALRGYVYAAQKPYKWPLYAAGAVALGIPMLIGYAIGKAGR